MQYFKHFTKMRSDTKVRRLFAKYGLEGYGLYNLIIESIAGSIETENPLPFLEETCDDIASFYNGNSAKIDEMVRFMIEEGLLEVETTEKKIACYKIYGYLEQSQTRSEKIRQLIAAYKDKKNILDGQKCLRQSETKVIEENRKDKEENKNRKEESPENPAPVLKPENILPSETYILADLLSELHTENIDKGYRHCTPQQNQRWAEDIDKLNRLDGRSFQDIEKAIRWIKTPGQFWAPNVMSGSKLREKFPTIWAQMSQRNTGYSKPDLKVNQRTTMLDLEE